MRLKGNFFSPLKLAGVDYLVGGLLLLFCFFSFFQGDIYTTGWNSLNYLFGNPLSFYENCKKIQGGGEMAMANYPPSIYIIFAAWLSPFKLLGLIKSPAYFYFYFVYWLKVLTSLTYVATGVVFYKVTQRYCDDKTWGKYVTWLWLTTPLALFSQFIFSQYDIFYVFLTLIGFLFFLDRRLYLASFMFSLAITFKYFPFFVFFPLLLFFEKKVIKLFVCTLIFLVPSFLIHGLYGHSPAYIEGVLGFSVVGRVFYTFLDVGVKIYYIFAIFTILSGIAYLLESTKKNYKEMAAYFFLFGAIYPFLFMLWHPQWLIFVTPAIVLTTVISVGRERMTRLLYFDLIAMFFFIAYASLAFRGNVDVSMLQHKLLHIPFFPDTYMGNLFKIFKGFSENIYFSAFWGYLVLQLISKYNRSLETTIDNSYCYANVRRRYYIGLLIFLIPAMLSYFISYNRHMYSDGALQQGIKMLQHLL